MSDGQQYRSYLLRLWRANASGATWRAMLEEVQGRRHYTFHSLAALLAFLERQAEDDGTDKPHPPASHDAPPERG